MVLIVGSKKTSDALGKLLVPRYYQHYAHAASGAKARQALSLQQWALVVVNTPLLDESAILLAEEIAHEHRTTVILLENAPSEAADNGIIKLVKPINKLLLEHTLQVIAATQLQVTILQDENRKLTGKLEESRLIGRAKCALVVQKNMTESEAHRYIEKLAMDKRLPKREVAKDILWEHKNERSLPR